MCLNGSWLQPWLCPYGHAWYVCVLPYIMSMSPFSCAQQYKYWHGCMVTFFFFFYQLYKSKTFDRFNVSWVLLQKIPRLFSYTKSSHTSYNATKDQLESRHNGVMFWMQVDVERRSCVSLYPSANTFYAINCDETQKNSQKEFPLHQLCISVDYYRF